MNATICRTEYGKKYLAKRPDGGFRSVYPDKAVRYAIVNGTSVTIGFKFKDDGPVVTELYEKTEYGPVVKVDTEEIDVALAFKNRKACVTKYVYETRTDEGKILTDELVGPWLTEGGVTEFRKGIEIPDGTYPMECGSIVVRDDCEIYQDFEHVAWYTEVIIDGKSETCRAKLLDLGTDIRGDKCIDVIQRSLSAIKAYAESCNIKLWYDTGSDAIRVVKVPKGYKCTMDYHEYKDQIPWELMPVVGKLSAYTDHDSEWQMGLVKIPEVKEGDHADK